MKRYPAYQDSGIEWIGEVPVSWANKRLKYLARLINEKGLSYGEDLPINLENIESWTGRLITEEAVEKESSEEEMKRLKAGDVLFNKLRPYLAKVHRARTDGICGGELLVLRPQPENMRAGFLFYRLVSKDFIGVVDGATYGTKMPRASWDFIGNLKIPYPSTQEQEDMSGLLDNKTAQIDDLIAKKKRMIELLKEERAAVINQAVIKGLNPNAEMKDSGIDWFGKIPKHWQIKKLKYLSKKIGSGITPKGGASVYLTEGIPILRSQNIHSDGLRLDEVAYISEDIHREMSTTRVLSGDVLLNITGASIGRCNYWKANNEANVNQHVCIIRPNGLMKTKFIYYFLSSEIGQLQIDLSQSGISREGLSGENLGRFFVTLPIDEGQRLIVNYLDLKTAQIDTQIDREKRLIELLKEYRTALISEVVTGKIDVRG